jgi:hypothetical protein
MMSYGYIDDWRPQRSTRQLCSHVNTILTEYAAQLFLLLGQIYYRFAFAFGYAKTQQFYDGVSVHFECIPDETLSTQVLFWYAGESQFWERSKRWAQTLHVDRMVNQERHIALWREAAGMVPEIGRLPDGYGIAVDCSGGFDRVTGRWRRGREWAALQESITVLHICDHDPGGVHIVEALTGDIIVVAEAAVFEDDYRERDIKFFGLAITREHAALHAIPDNGEPRDTDSRRPVWELAD